MNFFFGIKNEYLSSLITIPKFQNSGIYLKDYSVFEAEPNNNNWTIKKSSYEQNDNFFFIKKELIENSKIFFLSSEREINDKYDNDFRKLKNLNNFTDTSPSAFRSNLRIYLKDGGFSSYQSEYPFEMTGKKGNILSSVSTLLDPMAETNYIFFKKIFNLPIREKSFLYFVDILEKVVLDKIEIQSNFVNEIIVNKDLIKKNIYIFSQKYLGIPLYVSINDKHVSFEHTHPPHHYILSDDKFKLIKNLKMKIHEIIDQKTI